MSPSIESTLIEEIFRMSAGVSRIEERLDRHIEAHREHREDSRKRRSDLIARLFSGASIVIAIIALLKGTILK